MSIYLANAFSLNMVPDVENLQVTIERITIPIAQALAPGAISVVGHAPTAAKMGAVLGVDVPYRRVNLSLSPDDTLIVAQYIGPRLPEGATTLPEGDNLRWYRLTIRA